MNRLLLLYVILHAVADLHNTPDTLQMVQVIFRHGERAPSFLYRTDPHKDYLWPDGFWQLSNRGKQQLHQLGISLRIRYGAFLPRAYHAGHLYTFSSYADRCQMSAQLVQLGLYPPLGAQVWNVAVPWQPIPVQTLPREDDNLVAIKKPCPKLDHLVNTIPYNDTDLVALRSEHSKLFNYLSEKSGQPVVTLRHVESLFNTLEIEELQGLILPGWTKGVYPQPMAELARISLAVYTWTDQMKRLHGGVLLRKLLTDMVAKTGHYLSPDYKMLLYSGHDLTLMSIMRIFGIDAPKPEFGAAFIVELHKISNKNVVKVFYQAKADAPAQELYLKKCVKDGICELEILREVLRPITPQNWSQECVL